MITPNILRPEICEYLHPHLIMMLNDAMTNTDHGRSVFLTLMGPLEKHLTTGSGLNLHHLKYPHLKGLQIFVSGIMNRIESDTKPPELIEALDKIQNQLTNNISWQQSNVR